MKLIVLIASIFIASNVFACECVIRPFGHYIQKSEFIAKVKVLKVSEPTVDGLYQDAQIEILELFKGKSITTIKIFANLNTDCDLRISENSIWLIFARNNSSGLIQFDLCSGSLELSRSHASREYPNAQTNWEESLDRKLSVLRFLKSNQITNLNEFDLILESNEKKLENLRGYLVTKDKFAVYQLTVEKNLVISKIKPLKEFDNKELSDSLFNNLKVNKKVANRRFSSIEKKAELIIIYYYYDADELHKSFISTHAL